MEHLEELWSSVLAQVEQKISKPSFETWLKSTKMLTYQGETVTIAAPNSFARDWLETHYVHLIAGILTELTGEGLSIQICCTERSNMEDFSLPKPIIPMKDDEQPEFSPGMLKFKIYI